MNLENFLKILKNRPETIDFKDLISVIDNTYDFIPT